jgi:hypothetical protein
MIAAGAAVPGPAVENSQDDGRQRDHENRP